MKSNNFLITVTNDEIKELKVKNVNFLFPIKDFCVGYEKTYEPLEIDVSSSFIYINRILDNKAIENLVELLKNLPSNVIGICFTDLGVLQVVKKLNLNLKLIYMQNHNTTNVLSINYYLEDVDSILISTDITEEEIICILDNCNKPLVVPYFMMVDVMYSRRKLLTNFKEEFGLRNDIHNLHEPISNNDFFALENEYGTVLYDKKFIDYRKFYHENILFFYINPIGLTKEDVKNLMEGKNIAVESTDGFLHRKTYYRLKEDA